MACFVGSVSKVLFKDESGKAERWEEQLGCPEQAVKGPSLLWVGHILMLFIFFLFFEVVFVFLMWTILKSSLNLLQHCCCAMFWFMTVRSNLHGLHQKTKS